MRPEAAAQSVRSSSVLTGLANRLPQYLHTLRYLKPEQLVWQVLYRLTSARPDLRPAPDARAPSAGGWQAAARRRASLADAAEFTFLNQRRRLSAAADWNNPAWDRLWLYNLHYFDDLNACDASARVAWHRTWIDRWIAENPPGAGVGWEPYPTSVRIANWVKWALCGNPLQAPWRESLAVQVRSVSSRLERHLMGNHLFTNAKALLLAGLFFAGREADRWRSAGLALVARELEEQVLADGGHFERSPMYHALVLEDVLDLINVSQAYPGEIPDTLVAHWRHVASRMLRWLKAMCHPDGKIVLFNDAAFGIAPETGELERYATRLRVASAQVAGAVENLVDSGYVRATCGPAVLFVDVAPIGPDYLPAHGHADSLGFELSLFGQRWLVDSGCSCYDAGHERLRQRSTAAHNTVVVDGQDSSEVWASFRVARRAKVFDVQVTADEGRICVAGAHDGFRRLGGNVTHRRSWRLKAHGLVIEDSLEGNYSSAEAFLHFHPDVSIEKADARGARLQRGGRFMKLECDGGELRVDRSTWHPEFGLALPNTRVRIAFKSRHVATRLEWVPDPRQ
jgi:uncharacterized heparinase superfamily protein